MHHSNTFSNTAACAIVGGDENKAKNQKKEKNFVGTPVTNKFFKPKTTLSTPLPLKSIMNNSNNKLQKYVDREINRSSIIYSEDVSRKKMKLDETCKMKKFYSMSKGGTEDFLENLKKNIDKKMMSQPILEGETRIRKKPEAKKKVLFNDESLKLMNNFKEHFKDRDNVLNKDNILQQLATQEISLKTCLSKSNTVTSHKNNDNQVNTLEGHDCFVYNEMPQIKKFEHSNREPQTPILSNYSPFMLKDDDLISNVSQLQRSESGLTKILLDPTQSFKSGTTIISDRETDPDECPTPPQVEAMSLRYIQHSQKKDFNDISHYLSYF